MSAPNGSEPEDAGSEVLDETGPIVPLRVSLQRARQRTPRPPQRPAREPLTVVPPASMLDVVVGVPSPNGFGEPVRTGPQIGELGAQLRAEMLPTPKRPSSVGWRKWLYHSSFGAINMGESRSEAEIRELTGLVRSPWRGIHSLVVLGGKGGVGKTMVTAAVGSMLADLRHKDMVLATDADPGQSANLAAWIDPSASSTFADVLAEDEPTRNFDLRFFVGQNPETGLDVLAANAYSGRPRSELNSEVYAKAHKRLQRLYSLLLTDTGVDFWHPVMPGVLQSSDGVLMVASAVPGGAEGAIRAIEWLIDEGYDHLVRRMVVVINHLRGFDSREDRRNSARLESMMAAQFNRWVSPDRIVALPYDPHIAIGGPLDLGELQPATWVALLKATAAVSSGVASSWSQ